MDPFISTIFLGDARKMGMESAFPALVKWEQERGSLEAFPCPASPSTRNAFANRQRSLTFFWTFHLKFAQPLLGEH